MAARKKEKESESKKRKKESIPLGDSVLELLEELRLVAPLEHVLRHVLRLAHVLLSEISFRIQGPKTQSLSQDMYFAPPIS